ncbi:Wall-associated receptor kinase-like 2 [Dichanthelium oligosanthes]|uniref:Wall-associated receptor kinase-like 2 n=1 Tax=Dichanthelium oligosanthes TaxID=888268 RepID=A0A1E5W2S7_9POAL|nr:Wall-associated receptor kinase-like 2 [Dichanthelium oligosanthes]
MAAAADMALPPMPAPRPDCPSTCGDMYIPYPFGIGDNCSWPGEEYGFNLSCNYSFNPPRLYQGNIEIISIKLEAGEIRVFSPVSYICYNSSNTTANRISSIWKLNFVEPFLMSHTRNAFIGIGCNTVAFIDGGEGEEGRYHFKRRDLTRVANRSFTDRVGDRTIPLVLDWAIRNNGSCRMKLGDDKSAKPAASACQVQWLNMDPVYMFVFAGTFFASVLACLAIMEVKRRKQKKFFDKNGGEILKSMGINIFTERQLKKITNRYSTPIGEGAFGKVFLGAIDAAQRVAVKRSCVKGEALRQEDFVNEITIQFRISHANLVRLVGCCLETDIPMLVFEFVPNGSLYNVLHGTNKPYNLSLLMRLDIAIGSAEALAYMHSHGGHNHVHGDVKSGNILLDENLTPKVSDFGSSKLVSIAMHANWSVAGDMNYIDPVYIKTGRFTVKSDVYSFGVVLLELITRKTAKYDGCRSLPIDFVMTYKDEHKRRGMYDRYILSEDDAQSHVYMDCLDRVGELAVRCLKEDVEERPSMAEVVEELKQVKSVACGHSCPQASCETCTVNLSYTPN